MVNTLADRILGSLWKGFLSTPPMSCVASGSSPYFSGTTASPTAYSESPPGHHNCVPVFLCAVPLVILLLVKDILTPPGTYNNGTRHITWGLYSLLPTFKILPPPFLFFWDSWRLPFLSFQNYYSIPGLNISHLVSATSFPIIVPAYAFLSC